MPVLWRPPARNSRHRVACFALYRALLRQAINIPIPPRFYNSATELNTNRVLNPVQNQLRLAFQRNRNDTSPRLITAALKAGYRSLSLLIRARDEQSPEHEQIISFLAKRLEEIERSRRNRPTKPSHTPGRHGPVGPPLPPDKKVIKRVHPAPTVENPVPTPVYEVGGFAPRPLKKIRPRRGRKIRKPPFLAVTHEVPFLRITKPQPELLSQMLYKTVFKRIHRKNRMLDLARRELREWAEEDAWENQMEALVRNEQRHALEKGIAPAENRPEVKKRKRSAKRVDNETTQIQLLRYKLGVEEGRKDVHVHERLGLGKYKGQYAESVKNGVRYLSWWLHQQRRDSIARAVPMRQIVHMEKGLAEKERPIREAAERKAYLERKNRRIAISRKARLHRERAKRRVKKKEKRKEAAKRRTGMVVAGDDKKEAKAIPWGKREFSQKETIA